jgi:hypothetical protein
MMNSRNYYRIIPYAQDIIYCSNLRRSGGVRGLKYLPTKTSGSAGY